MNPDLQVALAKCLEKVGQFTPFELGEILAQCSVQEVSKGSYLLKRGEVCSSFQFILSGAACQYREDDAADGVIELYTEFDCVVSIASLSFQKPAEEDIIAFTDCRLLNLSLQSLHDLIGKSAVYFQLGKIMQPGWFRVGFFDRAMSPQEKYRYVLENKPELIRTFPLKKLASYLKIAPETLSRVRAAR